MVVVERVGQPLRQLTRVVVIDINQRGNAVAFLVERLRRLADAGAGEVSDRFRAVLVAAGRDDAVELQHELVVDSDGHALHGGPSRYYKVYELPTIAVAHSHLSQSLLIVAGIMWVPEPSGADRGKGASWLTLGGKLRIAWMPYLERHDLKANPPGHRVRA